MPALSTLLTGQREKQNKIKDLKMERLQKTFILYVRLKEKK